MSRLDSRYLLSRGLSSWAGAYMEASERLTIAATSFKNLRDEFDPFLDNARRGWWQREIRPDRQRVLHEFDSVSDSALVELVARILVGDQEAIEPAIEVVASASTRVSNVADRLLTGRMAEDYFMSNFEEILNMPGAELRDERLSARGFDFGLSARPNIAIEVKGMRDTSGNIQFTDREWSEAGRRQSDYWLVVIGNLQGQPLWKLVADPSRKIKAVCSYQATIAASWRARINVSTELVYEATT